MRSHLQLRLVDLQQRPLFEDNRLGLAQGHAQHARDALQLGAVWGGVRFVCCVLCGCMLSVP